MPSNPEKNLPSLEDLLPEALHRQLGELSPGISWALDSLVLSFGEEINNLHPSALEAFARLTLHYGENLQRFLHLAHVATDGLEENERRRKMVLLRQLDLFSELNDFDLGQIASAFEPVGYDAGEVLAREGQKGEAVFFLEEGQVDIVVEGNQVAVRGAGSLFGETSCITGEPVTATLRASSECRVLRMPRERFENLMLNLPAVVLKISRMGLSRLDEATHRLSEVLSHMPDALLKIDPRGIITGDVSSKCFEFLGTNALTGQSFPDLFFKDHPALLKDWEKTFPQLWENPELFHDSAFLLPRACDFMLEGNTRHYALNLVLCRRHGKPGGFDVAITDLTEQKRIEEERKRMEQAMRGRKRQFMLFRLAGESFGLPIERVREIIQMPPITRLPNAPPYLRGFFNLRGHIIPAVELMVLLNLSRNGESKRGCIFIVESERSGQAVSLGLIADEVDDILEIYDGDISDPPEYGSARVRLEFLHGVAKVGEEVKMLLDVDGLLSLDQASSLAPEMDGGGEQPDDGQAGKGREST